MTNSLIYKLFVLHEKPEVRKRREKQTFYYEEIQNCDRELSELLTDRGKDLFQQFKYKFVDHTDELTHESNVRMLNMGIFIGLQLADAFRELED